MPPARRLRRAIARATVGITLRNRIRLLDERQAMHAAETDPDRIAAWQLAAVNRIWTAATRRYRFYAAWKARHHLPERLGALTELAQFPILRKADVEANLVSIGEDASPCRFIGTGGSSGPSVLYPRTRHDDVLLYSSMYLGRSWAAIRPGDPIVLIWGHDHLYGTGVKGRIARAKRRAMDWLIDTQRLDAYRLDDAALAAYEAALRARPGSVIVGYVSAIRRLLDFLERSAIDGRSLGSRAVIFCSEAVFPRDLERVRRILGCPPLIEYGMGETGVMAYSRPDSDALTFLWDAVHCHVAAHRELIATTLQPRHFPLINYGTGDRVEPARGGPPLPFRCARVNGRTRDLLALALRGGGSRDIHSELLEDCLDLVPGLRSYFIHQRGDATDIAVRLDGSPDLTAARDRFLRVLQSHVPDIDPARLSFSRLEAEPLTIAGKRRYVLRD